MRTWNVIRWVKEPDEIKHWVPLDCDCGYEACAPALIKAPIIASFGMRLVFEPSDWNPPEGFLPEVIQCRKCKKVAFSEDIDLKDLTDEELDNVR